MRPRTPPKPPILSGTGYWIGSRVRPASDSTTSMLERAARRPASSRASVMPPRTSTRYLVMASEARLEVALGRPWLSIVGIGEDGIAGLGENAQQRILDAEYVFGG